MSKELIISSTPEETIAAVLDAGEVAELFFERRKNRSMVGSVYKGRVKRVLPGMQAAFVDIGLERDGFLYVTEIYEEIEDSESVFDEVEQPPAKSHKQPIQQMLKAGQEVLVQVAKAPMELKGARLTSHVTLAGRYLVFMPTVDHIGVSRKIESADERARLRSIIRKHRKSSQGGFIVRTAAEGKSEDELATDIRLLAGTWEQIREKADSAQAPACLHSELSLTEKLLRDVVTADFSTIRIDSEGEYLRCVELLDRINPRMARRVRLHTIERDILDEYGVTEELERSLRSKVVLKSGGYIVINETEALVAIDVNTGRFVGKKDFEETILHTNLEAAKEVARQIRLRNLGGILVLDFIDMEDRKNQRKVVKALEAELKKDRYPTVVLPINDFGLALITRKRVQSSVVKLMSRGCPHCAGAGLIKSADTIAYWVAREVRKLRRSLEGSEVVIRVHPEVADLLKKEDKEVVRNLERSLKKSMTILSDASFHEEQYSISGR
ncbi:MAG: Rne/Rng family ribonuclease [Acidobacteriota bacterium]